MIVSCYLAFWSIMSFFIPTKHRKFAIWIFALALPALYFWFNIPNEDYDLARYYRILDQLRNYDLIDLLNGKFFNESIYARIYIGDVYVSSIIYFWLISKIGINAMLPYITGVIVYYSLFELVYMMSCKLKISRFKFGLIISIIVMTIDYAGISGVRNICAFACLAVVLYYDFIENGNKLLCVFFYGVLILFHSSVIIVVLIRCIFLLKKYTPYRLVLIICLLVNPMLGTVRAILTRISGLSIVATLLEKITAYSERDVYNYRLVLGSFLILLFVICVVMSVRRVTSRNLKYYNQLLMCLVVFSLGSITNDILFNRIVMMTFFMALVDIVVLINMITSDNLRKVYVQSNSITAISSIMAYSGIYIMIIFWLFYNTRYSYTTVLNYFFK